MKKIFAIALAFVLAFPASLSLAVEPEAEATDLRAREIEAECYEQALANAVYVDENGDEVPLDVTYTVSVVSPAPGIGTFSAMSADEDAPVTYMIAASATAKIKSNSASMDNNDVKIDIYLTMYWTDVPGYKNTIDRLTGSHVLSRGTITQSYVCWDDSPFSFFLEKTIHLGTAKLFDKTIGFTSSVATGTLFASYVVKLGDHTVSVDVQPTIFDT